MSVGNKQTIMNKKQRNKLREMIIALRLSKERACILLTSYNNEVLRQEVEAGVKQLLEPEGFNFREFRVTGDCNLSVLLVRMDPQPEDVFLIYDLRKAIPEEYYTSDSSNLPRPLMLDRLNYRREDFVEFKISAIFWLDDPTTTLVMRRAPDFFAFRAHSIFEFLSEEVEKNEGRGGSDTNGLRNLS